nr:glycosyltransferase family 4 protein [Actinomycetales bacterium]
MRVGFVTPDLGRPSGGSAYNTRVIANWPAATSVETVVVSPNVARPAVGGDGGSTARSQAVPGGGRALDAALEEALRRNPVSVVDGLLGSEHPDVIERAEAAGHRVLLLMHMPRPDDVGLTAADRERLATLEQRAVRAASAIVSPSTWGAAEVARRYGRADALVAVPGVERAPVARGSEPLQVLQLGAVGPLKNQELVLRAVQQLAGGPSPAPEFRLRIVGPVVDLPAAERLQALTAALPQVTAGPEGPLEGEELEQVFAGTDLLVSVATRETYGLVVTEALARGIPAIAGRGTGAEEALAAGGAAAGLPGVTVSPSDPVELARALGRWLTEPELRRDWRSRALAARPRLPRWEHTAQTISDAASAALSRGSAR